jgi:hypothetical protein
VHRWVLQGDEGGVRVEQSLEELSATVHIQEAVRVPMQPHYSCIAEESAGRLPDDEIEASVYEV